MARLASGKPKRYGTREQRRWVHKTGNVLNKLPKSQQSKAKRALQKIWIAETKRRRARGIHRLHRNLGVPVVNQNRLY
jgi:transposase-like protein